MESNRHIDTGEAMRHNEAVEQARHAEHLRRCAESPAYKRVYERWLEMGKVLTQQMATTMQTLNDQMRQQTVLPISEAVKTQTAIHKPTPLPPPSDLQCLAGCCNPWSWFMLGMMFVDEERLKQMKEDMVAMKEMQEVNEQYDRQMIRMSGFEW